MGFDAVWCIYVLANNLEKIVHAPTSWTQGEYILQPTCTQSLIKRSNHCSIQAGATFPPKYTIDYSSAMNWVKLKLKQGL